VVAWFASLNFSKTSVPQYSVIIQYERANAYVRMPLKVAFYLCMTTCLLILSQNDSHFTFYDEKIKAKPIQKVYLYVTLFDEFQMAYGMLCWFPLPIRNGD
jgi:hypothetical protein